MSNIQRPLALITGASSGIGFELAKQFADHGFDIAMSSSSDAIYSAAEQITKLGVEAYPFKADASTYEGVEGFWKFTQALGRQVHSAVLNVGICKGGAFVDTSLEDEFKILAVNVTGTIHMAKRVVHHMYSYNFGKILIVSSVSATTPTPYETCYGPSKAFGFSFAESLREELIDTGISVTALLPGATNTEFHANAGLGNSIIGRSQKNDKTHVAMQGYMALMTNLDFMVGGDTSTQQVVVENKTTPETVKAARHAKLVKLPE